MKDIFKKKSKRDREEVMIKNAQNFCDFPR